MPNGSAAPGKVLPSFWVPIIGLTSVVRSAGTAAPACAAGRPATATATAISSALNRSLLTNAPFGWESLCDPVAPERADRRGREAGGLPSGEVRRCPEFCQYLT